MNEETRHENTAPLILPVVFAASLSSIALAENKPVGITPDIMSVSVKHNGQTVEIKRNQDNGNTVIDAFAKTSRPCPPFCIQPMTLAEGVETLGEVEVLDYAAKMSAGDEPASCWWILAPRTGSPREPYPAP